ncbi:MAG: DUF5658 family protein [Thaumarchaeota archaeon]|nr:DUF5658 family protein [Nitrososphaerota archaeon]
MVNYSERIRQLNERDKKWLSALDLLVLDKALRALFVLFVALSVLDVASTLVAMTVFRDSFYELNRVAAILFGGGIFGFVFSVIVLMVIPTMLIIYPLLLKENDHPDSQPHEIRQVKLAVIIALVVANLFYGYIVLLHNIPVLISRIV